MVEQNMIEIHDKNTILELSGFVRSGNSYAADEGFHDDLVMGLVLFAWLTVQPAFEEFRQDFSLRKSMFADSAHAFEEEMMPAAYIEDGRDSVVGVPETIVEDGVVWTTLPSH